MQSEHKISIEFLHYIHLFQIDNEIALQYAFKIQSNIIALQILLNNVAFC